MDTGRWVSGIRAKEGAYDTIDNIVKFALDEEDYEEYEEWVEYTEEELAMIQKGIESLEKRAAKNEFLESAPERMNSTEACISALTSAFGEVV